MRLQASWVFGTARRTGRQGGAPAGLKLRAVARVASPPRLFGEMTTVSQTPSVSRPEEADPAD